MSQSSPVFTAQSHHLRTRNIISFPNLRRLSIVRLFPLYTNLPGSSIKNLLYLNPPVSQGTPNSSPRTSQRPLLPQNPNCQPPSPPQARPNPSILQNPAFCTQYAVKHRPPPIRQTTLFFTKKKPDRQKPATLILKSPKSLQNLPAPQISPRASGLL